MKRREDPINLPRRPAAIKDWFAQAQARLDTQWRLQWARAEWTLPYRTTFTLAWDADGAIDFAVKT